MIFNNDEIVEVIEVIFNNNKTEEISIDMIVVSLVSLSPDEGIASVALPEVVIVSRFDVLNLLSCSVIIFKRIWM